MIIGNTVLTGRLWDNATARDLIAQLPLTLTFRDFTRHEGYIRVGGVEKEVAFVEEIDPGINDTLDAAYRTKYRRYASYVPLMIAPEARATTTKLVPHGKGTAH